MPLKVRFSAGLVALMMLLFTGCSGDGGMVVEDIPLPNAKHRVDIELTTPIPQAFVTIKAVARHADWGAEARAIEVAFNAPASAVRDYVVQVNAQKDAAYMDASNCPPSSKAASVPPAPPPSVLSAWYDRDVFDRCETVERWTIPQKGLTNGRSAGALYIQTEPTAKAKESNPLTTVLVSVSTA